MKKVILMIGFFLCMLILGSGCETLEDAMKPPPTEAEKAQFVITINEIVEYPRAKKLEKEIQTFNGRTIWVNTNMFMHSRDIEEIKVLPSKDKEGFFDLSLKLNRKGRVMWISLCEEVKTKKFGVIIDGTFYRLFQPEKMISSEDELVTLKGPFDPVTAEAVAKHSAQNYKTFNKDK